LSREEALKEIQRFVEEDQPATTLDNEEVRRDLRSLLEIKTIFLSIAGYESAAVDMDITPDDTAHHILARVGLEECRLCSGTDLANLFEPTEAVFEKLQDGQSVFVILPAEA
jgi:hypothetical protein